MSQLYYRGDNVFLYVQFKTQSGGIPISVTDVVVDIVHEKNGELIYELDQQEMSVMSGSTSEFYYSSKLKYDASYGLREVIYRGTVDGKQASIVESFHVIPNPQFNEHVIKISGIVNQLRAGYPLIGTNVKVTNGDEIFSESFTKDDGSWECYLYPGNYTFTFTKFGFIEQEVTVQIGDEQTELTFGNIALESRSDKDKGSGMFRVTDKYTTKNNVPLNGLKVEAINILDMQSTEKPTNITNDDGEWELYLDPGMYLLKINGYSMDQDYNYTFRLKVNEDGNFQFENLSNNVAIASDEENVSNSYGNNPVMRTDTITDVNGNPIIDVQVNVFLPNDTSKIIAQDYTSETGSWFIKLDSGTYIFEYYHPEFNTVTESKTF